MQNPNYGVIEMKTNDEGGTAFEVLCSTSDHNYADSVYHAALAKAATSGRPCHGVVIIESDAVFLEGKAYEKAGE